MTDADYAARIYRLVFDVAQDDGDAYTRGILDAIGELDDREQAALECYYRLGKNFRRTAQSLGDITAETARRIVREALQKLRDPSASSKMSVSAIVGRKDKLLADMGSTIDELYDQIERTSLGAPVDSDIQAMIDLRKMSVSKIGLPARAYKHLQDIGVHSVASLLKMDSLDRLQERRGFGRKSRRDLIAVMRDTGYGEWADRME